MKTLIRPAFVGIMCALLSGCQTPEERTVKQMERVQRQMEKMQDKLDAMDREMQAKLK